MSLVAVLRPFRVQYFQADLNGDAADESELLLGLKIIISFSVVKSSFSFQNSFLTAKLLGGVDDARQQLD